MRQRILLENLKHCNLLVPRKEAASVALQAERHLQKQRGKKEKSLHVGVVEKVMWEQHYIGFSSYHGGKREGPSCQQFMGNGSAVFNEIGKYLIEYLNNWRAKEDYIQPGHTIADNTDIKRKCSDFGWVLLLLDSVMSLLNIKRGRVSDKILQSLEKALLALMDGWCHL